MTRMRERDSNAGFDSLLDTMTNAIGILIIVLAVSYLALQDSVNRVMRLEPVPKRSSAERLRDLYTQAQVLDETIDQLQTEWHTVYRESRYSLAQHKRTQERMAVLSASPGVGRIVAQDIHDIARQLEDDWSTFNRLMDEVDQLEQRVRRARQTIQLQRRLPEPKVTIARVPDPVPAPRDAQPLPFLCRYGRVVYYATDEMLNHLHRGVAEALKDGTESPQLQIRHLRHVADFFEQHNIGQDGLRWRLRVAQRVDAAGDVYRDVRAVLEWTSIEIGDDLERLQTEDSKHREILAKAVGRHVYAKYYVWGDSFAEYAVSRETADELGIPAGWVAKEGDAEYQLELMSIRVHTGRLALKAVPHIPERTPIPRIRIGMGIGGAPSVGGTAASPSFGVIGASPGVDYVD